MDRRRYLLSSYPRPNTKWQIRNGIYQGHDEDLDPYEVRDHIFHLLHPHLVRPNTATTPIQLECEVFGSIAEGDGEDLNSNPFEAHWPTR